MSDDAAKLLQLSQQLLDSIADGDWATYTQLCDPTLTAFEPEARGHLVEGMGFHRFYFEMDRVGPVRTTISSPHVRMMGDVAVVSYVRLMQLIGPDGAPQTRQFEETRVWRREEESWRHVHFHRSDNA